MNSEEKLNIGQLEGKTREELLEMAKALNLSATAGLKKQDLVIKLLQAQTEQEGNMFCSGVLETMDDGYGFLRQSNFLPSNNEEQPPVVREGEDDDRLARLVGAQLDVRARRGKLHP